MLGDIIATIHKEQNRISYLLYNYEDTCKPSEFCIIGSSDMLLNYISSGLPELDVNHVTQMRMDQIIPYLMHSAWKKKYRIVSDREDAKFKSRLEFAEALDRFLSDWRLEHVSLEDIKDEKLGMILSSGNLSETFRANSGLSILQLEKLFNARIASRIRFLCSETEEERTELLK